MTNNKLKPAMYALYTTLACTFATPTAWAQPQQTQVENGVDFRTLIDQGVYWYRLHRFNLANQLFNKILLINPDNAEALKWKGLIDVHVGQIQSANIWLQQLQQQHGANHPQALELKQVIQLATDNRQSLTEIQNAIEKKQPSDTWLPKFNQLFTSPPLGEAAVTYYSLLSQQNETLRQPAREHIQRLIQQFPQDNRYPQLLSQLSQNLPDSLPSQVTDSAPQRAQHSAPTPLNTNKLVQRKQRAVAAVITSQPVQNTLPKNQPTTTAQSIEPKPSESPFERAQQFASLAQQAHQQGDLGQAIELLQQAIQLDPSYPWFRFELATLYVQHNTPNSNELATQLMSEGRSLKPNEADMLFASALIAEQLKQPEQALALLSQIAPHDLNTAMRETSNRLALNQHVEQLNRYAANGQYNQLEKALQDTQVEWQTDPTVLSLNDKLSQLKTPRMQLGWNQSTIQGSPGVSQFNSDELLFALNLPIDAEQGLFFRVDQFQAEAGDYTTQNNYSNLIRFGSLGTLSTTQLQNGQTNPALLPNDFFRYKNQSYTSLITAIGWQSQNLRLDFGKPQGDFPVKSWVGGLRWQTHLHNTTLEFDMSQRMVLDSLLSAAGTIDPLTEITWGGARRTGLKAVSYTPFDNNELIGIIRINQITGQAIPKNNEQSAQLIVKKTLYQTSTQQLKVGVSGMLWQFQRNLGLFTLGQGGYYSPNSFQSLTFPLEWLGQYQDWSWQVQAEFGYNRAREDATPLYLGQPDTEQAALAALNPITQVATKTSSDRYGLRLAIEKQIANQWVAGFQATLDRSANYAPDTAMLYFKYQFNAPSAVSSPPQPVSPYARF